MRSKFEVLSIVSRITTAHAGFGFKQRANSRACSRIP